MNRTGVAETVADRRVHPATVPLRFLKAAPSYLLGLPAAFAYMSNVGWRQVLAFAAVTAALGIVLQYLRWRSFRYGLGARELVIESGILSRNRRSIPFERVQDVDIERGLLQRLFGLAMVRVETGGAARDEGLLDSVTLTEANRIRAALRARGVAADKAVEVPAVRTVFAMDLRRVLLAGLFNFSFVWIAGLFGFLQAFDGWLPFDIYDPGRWIGLVDARGGRFTPGAIIAVLFLALLLGLLTGIVQTLSRDFGFRLMLEEDRFRRVRGLFTRSEVVLAAGRVQLARIDGGPFRRVFGWHRLFFQTLSMEAQSGGQQLVAPLARSEEVSAILAAQGALKVAEREALQSVSRRHALRLLFVPSLVSLLAIAVMTSLWRPGVWLFLAVPALWALALVEARSHRFGIAGDLLFIQRGFLWRRLSIIPIAKVQTIGVRRSFLQRRLGLSSLLVDTAGAPALAAPWIVDLAGERADELARALTSHMRSLQASGRKSGTER